MLSVTDEIAATGGQVAETVMGMKETSDQRQVRGILRKNEPMSQHTSWHTGGVARYYFEPADLEDLSCYLVAIPEAEPLLWVGLGSNLLVRDGGFPGTVIATSRMLNKLSIEASGLVKVDAGVPCGKVAKMTARAGLSGAEFLVGIPATMGGALAMNAGAHGGETWDIVTGVTTLNRSGSITVRTSSDFRIDYRSVGIPADEWFISAELQLRKDPARKGEQRIREFLERRSATQPIGQSSCGSVFRNPPGDYAARLIEACGLKGARRGAACVSEKHANFIINLGGATAGDIEQLIKHVQETVFRNFSIALVPEVRIVGIM
ncbi:MAG: UDP-N-acetylmuramate dehydrogenase [Gammaproteobacteria bacterium]